MTHRFAADSKAHALSLLLHKAFPLKTKGAIRQLLESAPDEPMLIEVGDEIRISPRVVDKPRKRK